ncbi:DUF2637 domain-containing protein [Streptomyces pinistramenti]|uniref:DUF2637 domain-containing protein n=1 Tax=Streptomyces pinistramenti TaxID=2884812 RepID=UPI002222A8DA|nr:DUF2637 domain-containing protein [Streptomyces pinistramenti]
MNPIDDVLTPGQRAATQGAMAGATPETAPATPPGHEATPATGKGAPAMGRLVGQRSATAATLPPSTDPATTDAAPATPATEEEDQAPAKTGWRAALVEWLLLAVALVGMPLVGTIGFAASYTTLKEFAAGHGFGPTLAWWFPIGIDASIVALLAADLVMVRRGKAWPVLRSAAHAMTLATVVFNAADGLDTTAAGSVWAALWANPLRSVSHAAMPVLFILGVEAARHLLATDTVADRIPLHRWILSPLATPALYRRMRLAEVRSYPEMVQREKDLAGYKVWLGQKYKGDLSQATEKEQLPMTMASRGYTVTQALELPAQWEAAAEQRRAKEAKRQADAEAEQAKQQAEAEAEQAERDAELKITKLRAAARVEGAKHLVAAETGTAAAESEAATVQAQAKAESVKAQAERERRAAERQAQAEEDVLESAEIMAARRQQAEDDEERAKAEHRAKAELLAAKEKGLKAERVEADRLNAVAEGKVSEQKAAEAAAKAAEAALQAERDRAAAWQAECRAVAAEDYARLSPRERNERRIARMLLAAGADPREPDAELVPLKDVMQELGLKQSAAGDIRAAAVQLLKDGYVPDEVLDGFRS